MRVLTSCKTYPQVKVADNMFQLFLKKYPEFSENKAFSWSQQVSTRHFVIRTVDRLKMEEAKNNN